MARRAFTREFYDLLAAAFAESPDNAAHAARVAACDWRTARRAWLHGWAPRLPWAIPIRDHLALEQQRAQAALATEDQAERDRRARLREEALQDALKTQQEERGAVKLARGNAIGLMAMTNRLLRGASKLVELVQAQLEDPKADANPARAVMLLERSARAVRQANETAHRAMVMERLINGKPTDIIGVMDAGGDGDMSREEALAELQAARELGDQLTRASGELRVIDGGKVDASPAVADPMQAGKGKAG